MTKKIFLGVCIWLLIVGIYHTQKALPATIGLAGPEYQVESDAVTLFADRTYVDAAGVRHSEQEIFDEIIRMIEEAEHYVLIDMFLFNDFLGSATSSYRSLSSELIDVLIRKQEAHSDIVIQVITDPVNTIYGGIESAQLAQLEAAGVSVILTDLTPLRDSNPLYSTLWRTFIQWFGVSNSGGWLPNPLDVDQPKLGLRPYFSLLNYKANHRKLIVTDYQRDDEAGFSTLITSANPHDGSSAHSNMALRVDSAIWQDVIKSEAEVAWWSEAEFVYPPETLIERATPSAAQELTVQLLTESAIQEAVIASLESATTEDRVDLAMFYLADRDVVAAMKRADDRGVQLRVLLDPSKDAFGREKNGMPNRQVAHELMSHTSGNTIVRWCDTHGEQCHSKTFLKTSGDQFELIMGSANFTRRNLDDLNLETNVRVSGKTDTKLYADVEELLRVWWENEEGKTYSTEYETYADNSWFRTLRYRIKEFTGLSRW